MRGACRHVGNRKMVLYVHIFEKQDQELPFTFWTDLGYKEPPSVKMTEGDMLPDQQLFDKF